MHLNTRMNLIMLAGSQTTTQSPVSCSSTFADSSPIQSDYGMHFELVLTIPELFISYLNKEVLP